MANYQLEQNAQKSHFRIQGDLVVSAIPELRAALKKELERGSTEVVFNLAETTMIDSSGIGLLIATHNSISKKQGKIRVVNVSNDILGLLQSMRLVTRLNVTGNELTEVENAG